MASSAGFFERNARYFRRGVFPDDSSYDRIALFINCDFPADIINTIIRQNEDNCMARYIELANTHEELPDFDQGCREGTEANVEATWRSPFVGSSIQEITAWVDQIPKPPKAINKTYFAILDKVLYTHHSKVLICRRFKNDRVETIPMDAGRLGGFLINFRREEWRECHEAQDIDAV